MPNHCQNRLTVTGDHDELVRFMETVRNPERDVPEGSLGAGRECVFSIGTVVPEPPEGDPRRVPDAHCEGGWDWYHWRIENWGTKWDAYDTELLTDVTVDFDKLVYSFESAWAPPIEGLRRMSVAFPKLTFEHAYMEAGMCFYGEVTYRDGEKVEESEGQYDGDAYDVDEDTGEATAIHDPMLKAHVEQHEFGFYA